MFKFCLLFHPVVLCLLLTSVFALPRPIPAPGAPDVGGPPTSGAPFARQVPNTQVLILGGGVAGIIAARMLAAQGIADFLIVEARDELGGRMRSTTFGAPGRQLTVELGANWIHGTQENDGPANPIFELALKHNLRTVESHPHTSITTYDVNGAVDYLDVVHNAMDAYTQFTVVAGARIPGNLVDLTARAGYALVGQKPKTPHEMASEYYSFDYTYAQTPDQSSFLASSWGSNFTYDVDQGGFSEEDLLSIDQRGIKYLIQAEAAGFLKQSQVRLQATVATIGYSDSGVSVTLTDGTMLTAQYAICTFSLGVLQNDDVQFHPPLPEWKIEAIHSITMVINRVPYVERRQRNDFGHLQATFTKIFLQFPQKFWFDTEFAVYADSERGRYPVWQGLDIDGFMPGSGVIVATVTGDYSKRIEAMTDAQVQSEVMQVLRAMFPNVAIPEPMAFLFPRWFSDPLYRGSYSTWPASFIPQHLINLGTSLGNLWFAGEATSERYFGFLHGAYFEGEAAASQIAQCIKGQRCYPQPPILYAQNTFPYNV
ncbi:amine oxidase [Lactarius indigo]|nr:amine oxidase [Lactarius indigo]